MLVCFSSGDNDSRAFSRPRRPGARSMNARNGGHTCGFLFRSGLRYTSDATIARNTSLAADEASNLPGEQETKDVHCVSNPLDVGDHSTSTARGSGEDRGRRDTAQRRAGNSRRRSSQRTTDPGRPIPTWGLITKRRLLHLQRISSEISSFGRIAPVGPSRGNARASRFAEDPSAFGMRFPFPRFSARGKLCCTKLAISRIDRRIRTPGRGTGAIGPTHILLPPALSRGAADQVSAP